MKFEIPILAEQIGSQKSPLIRVRPLFFDHPVRQDPRLSRAMSRLATDLRKLFAEISDYDELARFAFCPDAQVRRLKLDIDLRTDILRAKLPVVTFWHLSRVLAFSPSLPELWFEVNEGETLKNRATDVYTWHLRQVEKEGGPDQLRTELGRFHCASKLWTSRLSLDVSTWRPSDLSRDDSLLTLFGGQQRLNGRRELEKVGRCLDRLFPEDLLRAARRSAEVEAVSRLLSAADDRPVLLVGPSVVGKTAILHEVVYRRVAMRDEKSRFQDENCVWLLTPQRLVSGMSYAGQWENRLLAILQRVRQKQHILYFDDFIGMYQAGITSHSDLSAADVLKPYVERREIQIVAEMTPEQLRVFRERDRGFADMFHQVRIEEPDEANTVLILIESMRSLETQFAVRFDVDVVPTVLELTRRYERDLAFPGKAVRWLKDLAVKYRDCSVDREKALQDFRAKRGLQAAFVDRRSKLERCEVYESLSSHVIGQSGAVDAMTDTVSIGKAGLSDPQRPLGSLLFLGPTGVGKTHAAKSLASYLFGDVSRLLRFDMNEFISPRSAARLVGTFDRPEGVLTSAVRRQPYSVVLFDEIEKAHPDVHDLMLQILGEARLTDALGRTVDFSNTVIILTSNLGTREASRQLGFASDAAVGTNAVYLKAVREFFRPEFVNRFDRIVPFAQLSRQDLQVIARTLLSEILQREGLSRRQCAIEIRHEALEWIIDRGYDPNLGARAMRRALESQMVRPIGRRMSAILPETPTVLTIGQRVQDIDVQVTALEESQPWTSCVRPDSFPDPVASLDKVWATLDRLQAKCQKHRPPGEIDPSELSAGQLWYLTVVEWLNAGRQHAQRISESLQDSQQSIDGPVMVRRSPRGGFLKKRRRWWLERGTRQVLKDICTVEDVLAYLEEVMSTPEEAIGRSSIASYLHWLFDYLAVAQAFEPTDEGWPSETVLVLIRSLERSTLSNPRKMIAGRLHYWFHSEYCNDDYGVDSLGLSSWDLLGDESTLPRDRSRSAPFWWDLIPQDDQRKRYRDRYQGYLDVTQVEGYRAKELLLFQEGTHLLASPDGRLQPIQVIVIAPQQGEDVGSALLRAFQQHEASENAMSGDRSARIVDPFRWRPVLTLAKENARGGIDFRMGGAVDSFSVEGLLPLPPELQD